MLYKDIIFLSALCVKSKAEFIQKSSILHILFYLDICLFKELKGELVGVAVLVNHPAYAGVYYHLGADDAGLVGAVKRRLVNRYAQPRRLDNGVLLGVDGKAQLVLGAAENAQLFPEAFPLLDAAFDSRWCPVVARGDYALVLTITAPTSSLPEATRPRGDGPGELRKLNPTCPCANPRTL